MRKSESDWYAEALSGAATDPNSQDNIWGLEDSNGRVMSQARASAALAKGDPGHEYHDPRWSLDPGDIKRDAVIERLREQNGGSW